MTPKEVSLSFTQILVQDNLSFTGHTYWAVFLFAKVLFVRYGIPLSYNHVHQAKNTVGDSSQWRMTLGMYVTIECPSSTNRHLHHSKYLNKRVSDSFQMLMIIVKFGWFLMALVSRIWPVQGVLVPSTLRPFIIT